MSIRFSDDVSGRELRGDDVFDDMGGEDADAVASPASSASLSPSSIFRGSSTRRQQQQPNVDISTGSAWSTRSARPSGSARASTRSMTSSASSRSASHRTLKFFRYIVGQRNADYCSDAPTPPPPTIVENHTAAQQQQRLRGGASVRSLLASAQNTMNEVGGPSQIPCWRRFLCFLCLWPSADRKHFLLTILQSRPWRALILVLTFILLFGAQIRNTVVPASADTAADAIFMATFCIFCIDIFMRIDAEPNYFQFSVCGFPPQTDDDEVLLSSSTSEAGGTGTATAKSAPTPSGGGASGGGSGGAGGGTTGTPSGPASGTTGEESTSMKSSTASHLQDHKHMRQRGQGCCGIEIGSFLFWCDVVSTLTLLHEISFIDKSNFSEIQIMIILDAFGVPVGA